MLLLSTKAAEAGEKKDDRMKNSRLLEQQHHQQKLITVHLKQQLEFKINNNGEFLKQERITTEEEWKEWIFEYHKDDLLKALTITVIGDDNDDNNGNNSNSTEEKTVKTTEEEEEEEKKEELKDDRKLLSTREAKATATATTAATTTTTTTQSSTNKIKKMKDHRTQSITSLDVTTDSGNNSLEDRVLWYEARLKLIEQVAYVQRTYLQSDHPKVVFGTVLDQLLQLMDSEFGFIGEILRKDDGTVDHMQLHACSNIAWDDTSQKFYEEQEKRGGLRFYNFDNLFGKVLTTAKPVISNNPLQDSRYKGVPKGHPPTKTFLGIPIFGADNEIVIGMVCISNRITGYNMTDVYFLEPFTVTTSNLIQAFWQIQENKRLINTLEEKVQELEQLNNKVTLTNQMQIQHFACMSHEIRTPLNCIVGLSSLLMESDDIIRNNKNHYDTIEMIVESGKLLATVVDDVLDYSKLETGNVDILIENTSIQNTILTVVRSIEMKAASRNIPINTYYDNYNIPEYINTDGSRLQQILYNILGNAVKFSRDNYPIELHVRWSNNDNNNNNGMSNNSTTTKTNNTLMTVNDDRILEEHAETTTTTTNTISSSHCPFSYQQGDKTIKSSSRCPFSNPNSTTTTTGGESKTDDNDEGQKQPYDDSDNNNTSGSKTKSTLEAILSSHLLPKKQQEDRKRYIELIVKDYGQGIDKKDYKRIFEPFRQASVETEKVFGGTGLGLSISLKLAQKLGGNIYVNSEKGKWTEFCIQLPIDKEPVNIESISKKLQHATIILIDDCSDTVKLMENILGNYNVKNKQYNSLQSAMAFFHTKESPCENNNNNNKESYVFFIHEDQFDTEIYKTVLMPRKDVIVFTHGKDNQVEESYIHFRSLEQMLPCVILDATIHALNAPNDSKSMQQMMKSNHPLHTSCTGLMMNEFLHVLIAEDNTINQKVLVRMLNRLGVVNIDVVDNGKLAVEKEATIPYDIVFMDMQMPIMDGVDACKHIVKRTTTTTTGSSSSSPHPIPPVVFVTAHAMRFFATEAEKAGCSAYISKPYSKDEIQTCIQEVRDKIEICQRYRLFKENLS